VIAQREPERVTLVDARGTPQETQRRILELTRRKLRLTAKSV
jgi:hypothetical protein